MSYLRLQIEESARYEGAPTTTPYRISTVARDIPIQTFRPTLGPTLLDRGDELRNIEGAPPRLPDGFEPGGSLAERMYLNDLVFLLTIAGWSGVVTAGDGIITDPDTVAIPAGVSRWVFTKRPGSPAKTAQLIAAYTEAARFYKGQGYGISQLSFNAAGELTADLSGAVLKRTADPGLSPSFDAFSIVPMRRADLQLTWLANSGETDDFTVSIANPLARRKSFGLATRSYFADKVFQGDERVAVTGTIPKYAMADADFDALEAASTFLGKARWKSDKLIGATAYPYTMWLEMPACQYVGGDPDDLANRRRFGESFEWFAAWDATAGYDAKITIACAIPAVETYAP